MLRTAAELLALAEWAKTHPAPRVFEYGVEYEHDNGHTFISPQWTELAAHQVVANSAGFNPRPARVVRRPIGEWEPANPPEASE